MTTANETPGAAYETHRSTLNSAQSTVFSKGPAHYSPEKGGSARGPYLGRLHADANKGTEGPGPGTYASSSTLQPAGGAKFGPPSPTRTPKPNEMEVRRAVVTRSWLLGIDGAARRGGAAAGQPANTRMLWPLLQCKLHPPPPQKASNHARRRDVMRHPTRTRASAGAGPGRAQPQLRRAVGAGGGQLLQHGRQHPHRLHQHGAQHARTRGVRAAVARPVRAGLSGCLGLRA